ncbi:tripartite tricarboxylate transporter substrate binding protein [Comamonadaceae bacterium G21597-S1]|nr:tripartite tricarboxylate transporter substrate binding protein [Comamonadaceae bacterium G21597-S1]
MTESACPTKRRDLLLRIACMTLVPASAPAWSQAGNVTRIVVPFTPGASNDVIGRMMAEAAARRSGTNWIVENKPGAGSMLGADAVAKAAPDGRTLLLCATANMGILPAIQKSMRYSVEHDFTFLVRIASSPFALAVNTQLPAASFADFVRLAKDRPGAMRFGSAGVGSLDYMGANLLQAQLGLDLNIIPYKGMAPVLNDLRAGHIDACIVSPPTVRPLVLDGKVRVLAVLDERRSELLPNVPSSTELGHASLKVGNWWGIAGPAKMDPAMVTSLRQVLMQVLTDPAFLSALKEKGFDPAVQSGEAFTQFVLADLKHWKSLAQHAKVSIDE